MPRWKRFRAKLWNFFHKERADRELDREVASHLALIEDDFRSQGMNSEEASRAAKRAYGGVEQVKELHRDERSFVWLEQIWQDTRHAYRSLAKSPGFVAVAVLSLAFGIGVNTAIFTLVNGILLKRLPVPDADRIVQVNGKSTTFVNSIHNYPVFRELRRHDAIFGDVVGFWARPAMLEVDSDPHKIAIELVTGSYFSFFGERPALGRLLNDEDDRVEGASPVCVISHPAWQTYFSGDPRVLGRTIRVDGVPLQIVGVAGPGFVGGELQKRLDIWVPTSNTKALTRDTRDGANWVWLRIMARLKPGLSFEEAKTRLEGASRAIEDALPAGRVNAGIVYQIQEASNGFDDYRKTLSDPLFILLGAVTMVLLVACANLANLLLARTNERHQEFTIKLALGISPRRLLRQLLLETFGLAFGGGVAAILFSLVLTPFLISLFNAGNTYNPLHVTPDASILVFTFGVCVLTALITGLYPGWQASRTDTGPGLKGGSLLGGRRNFVRRGLIVIQVGLAVVLLFGASLFAHSLRKLKTIDLGYDISRVFTVEIEQKRGEKRAEASPAHSDILARVRRLPGVESVALSDPGVLTGRAQMGMNMAYFMFTSPGYLSTLRIPLIRGRDFNAGDRRGTQPVAIVNQYLASRLWPGEDPIGKLLPGWAEKNIEIVGVAANSKYEGIRETLKPIAYLAFDQAQSGSGALQIRYQGPFGQIERDVRQIVKVTAPGYQVSSASSLEATRDRGIAQDRLLSFLSTLFGVLGVALALVGVYGLISYAVTSRTREIGIRMSVGAQRRDVLWLFLRESVTLVAIGALIGMPVALWLAAFLRKMLYEVSTSDPLSVLVTLLLLAAGGLFASSIPAIRATRTNPLQALRHE